jgi:hypothetical protein
MCGGTPSRLDNLKDGVGVGRLSLDLKGMVTWTDSQHPHLLAQNTSGAWNTDSTGGIHNCLLCPPPLWFRACLRPCLWVGRMQSHLEVWGSAFGFGLWA